MNTIRKADQLMIPVYINEKTVLDMACLWILSFRQNAPAIPAEK